VGSSVHESNRKGVVQADARLPHECLLQVYWRNLVVDATNGKSMSGDTAVNCKAENLGAGPS
jgi:hypothetical protein